MCRIATGLLILVFATLGACGGPKPQHKPDSTAGTLAGFDKVVTLEVLFPDPAVRALYRALPPEQRGEERSYAFELKPQPTMEPNRHFQFISVVAAPRGGGAPAQVGGTAGPNGSFVDVPFQTRDGRFEGRVSEGMLLPDSVNVPSFDLARAAQAIAARYEALQHQ